VHLRYVGLPAETAIQRAIDRFRETGRLVDPNQIIATGDQPRRDFDALKAEGKGRTYAEYSNSVPEGQPARIVAGGRTKASTADLGRDGRNRDPALGRGGPASDRPDEGRGPPAAAQEVARVFTKRETNTLIVVEELRHGKSRLAFKSMRIMKRGGPGATDAPPQLSEELQSLRPNR